MIVVLHPWEVEYALHVARARDLAAHEQRRTAQLGAGTLAANVTGAIGELTVAKALGCFWLPDVGGNDKRRGDVCGYQVRATARTPGELPVRDGDDEHDVFVLVSGEPPRLTIRGWIHGAEGRVVGERRAPGGLRPAYFVAAAMLHDWAERPFQAVA